MKYCILLFLLYNIDIILSFCISTNLYYKNNYNVNLADNIDNSLKLWKKNRN